MTLTADFEHEPNTGYSTVSDALLKGLVAACKSNATQSSS